MQSLTTSCWACWRSQRRQRPLARLRRPQPQVCARVEQQGAAAGPLTVQKGPRCMPRWAAKHPCMRAVSESAAPTIGSRAGFRCFHAAPTFRTAVDDDDELMELLEEEEEAFAEPPPAQQQQQPAAAAAGALVARMMPVHCAALVLRSCVPALHARALLGLPSCVASAWDSC